MMFGRNRVPSVILVAILGLLLWPALSKTVGAETAPAEVIAAAERGLSRFLEAIPPGEAKHFRFAGRSEIARADLDYPFQVHTLLPEEIIAGDARGTGEISIEPTGLWQFPVICDGSARTLLTVDRVDGGWEAVDLGGLSPAQEIDELAYHWPASEGYQEKYVRVFQTGSQFIAIVKDGDARFIPLESTARALGLIGSDDAYYYEPFDTETITSALAPHLQLDAAGQSR